MSDHENPRAVDDSDDETFRRLQSGDPAAGAEIDLAAVRREVDRRVAVGAGHATPAPTVAAPAATGPARWTRIAAVAAAVALVGSGAFVVGRQTGGGDGTAAGSGAVSSSTAMSASVQTAVAPPVGAMATRSPGPTGGGSGVESGVDQKLIGGGYGRTVFTDGGLSTDAGTAPVWGFDPSSVISPATAERIATAMGIPGTAVAQYQAWMVGPVDGTGPSVTLAGDGTASVNYNDPQAYPGCAEVPVSPSDVAVAPCDIVTPAELTGPDAITRATEVMVRIGLDPAGYTLTAPDDQAGGGYRSVIAGQLVDGRETGVQFWFSFVGDRLASFSGALAPLVSLGQYAVVSPADAVARLNDPRFGATSLIRPMETAQIEGTAPGTSSDGVPTPVAPTPGAAISWPVATVTLTGATLGSAMQYQADGSTVLVPTYTMTAADGSTWSVIAVADAQLDLTG